MKKPRSKNKNIIVIITVCFIIIFLNLINVMFFENKVSKLEVPSTNHSDEIIIATTICGDRLKQGLVMLKSAILFRGSEKIHFIIIVEYKLQEQLQIELEKMKKFIDSTVNGFTYQLYNVSYPEGKENAWYKEFRPCSTARLFLPTMAPDVDKVIYMDSDTVFVNEVKNMWQLFHRMNSSHLAAATWEDLEPNDSPYSAGRIKIPYYGKQGLNTGVMLMNFKKMREFGLVYQVQIVFEIFKSQFKLGDQDILNVIFHYYPDKIYVFPCYYNYRSLYCDRIYTCAEAETHGVTVVHGATFTFQEDLIPVIKAVYDTFDQYQLGDDPVTHLLNPLLKKFKEMPLHRCLKINETLVKNMIRLFSSNLK